MASVQTNPKSPFWIAYMRVWKAIPDHPQGGFFQSTSRSTKIPKEAPQKDALRAAEEMERIAQECRGEIIMDRVTFEKRVEGLLRSGGVEIPLKRSTWGLFSEEYLAECEAGASSLKKYRAEIRKFSIFLGARASRDLREIQHRDILAFYNGLKQEGLTNTTARATSKTIKAVFSRAHLLGYLESNPAALLKMENGKSVTESSREPFSIEEVKRLLYGFVEQDGTVITGIEGEERIAFLFGLTYGLRAGDASRRRYEEITVQNGVKVISFVPEKKRRKGKVITLPLIGELATLIKEGKGFITPGLAKLRHPSRWLDRAMSDAGIDKGTKAGSGKGRSTASKTFHSLRHTASSWLMQSGADQRMRQLICDHDDPRMNSKYTHASVIEIGKALEKSTALLVELTPVNDPQQSQPQTHTPAIP